MVGKQVHVWALALAEEVPLGVCDQTEAYVLSGVDTWGTS